MGNTLFFVISKSMELSLKLKGYKLLYKEIKDIKAIP